jgi:hypothetical protein
MIYKEHIIDQQVLDKLKPSCLMLAEEVQSRWGDWMNSWSEDYMKFADGSPSTKLYEAYNIFLCHAPGFYEVYSKVVESFKQKQPNWNQYAIAGWVNVYEKEGFLDWHYHGSDPYNHDHRWHGYVCVNAEPSKTMYMDITTKKLVETIENKNGQLVLNPAGIAHRTTPWKDETEPRITIAFDISLREQIDSKNLNRWIALA